MSERKFRPPQIEEFPKEWESEEVQTVEPSLVPSSPVAAPEVSASKIKPVDAITSKPGHFRVAPSMNRPKAVMRELGDEGMSGVDEWNNAFALEDEVKPEFKDKEPHEQIELNSFRKLFSYLESGGIPDRSKIERFGVIKNGLERLKSLQSMTVAEAAECIRDFGLTDGAYNYLTRRLEFYQKFIGGTATKKKSEWEYDPKKQESVMVIKEEVLDPANASKESIKLGVLRDIYYAAMQGTPEMGAVKIATKRVNQALEKKQAKESVVESKKIKLRSVVEFWGYYSGVSEGWLGQYTDLSQLYKECEQEVKRRSAQNNLDENSLEHRAVLLTARRLEDAYSYNGTLNTSSSPYNANFKEAVTVGKLGSKVRRQMAGMRRKIQQTDFRNVERFVGLSGDNRYDPERKRLFAQIKFLKESFDQSKKQELATRQNGIDIQKQQRWYEQELERLNRKLAKSKAEIEKAKLPDEERNLQLQSATERHGAAVAHVQKEYETGIAHLQARTPEQLVADLEQRQTIVSERFEKRKSLAQKALDLHFRFNHEGKRKDSDDRERELQRIESELESAVRQQEEARSKIEENFPDADQLFYFLRTDPITSGGIQKFVTIYEEKIQNDCVEKDKLIEEEYQKRKQHLSVIKQIQTHNFQQGDVPVDAVAVSEGEYAKKLAQLDMWFAKSKSDLSSEPSSRSAQLLKELTQWQALSSKVNAKKVLSQKNLDVRNLFTGVIDWINQAPLGTIKRVHHALQKGVSDQSVIMLALAEIYGDKEKGVSRADLDVTGFVHNLIRAGSGHQVIEGFEKFTGIPDGDHKEIAMELIKARVGNSVVDNFEKLKGIKPEDHLEVVHELIKAGSGHSVIDNFAKFKGIKLEDQLDLVYDLIKAGCGNSVASSLNKFNGIKEADHLNIAIEISRSGNGTYVIANIENFKGIPKEHEREIVFEAVKGGGGSQVAQSLEKLTSIKAADHRDLVMEMIKAGNAHYLTRANILNKFQGLENSLRRVIEAGKYEALPNVLEAGFTIEEITRFPFLISPLVTKR